MRANNSNHYNYKDKLALSQYKRMHNIVKVQSLKFRKPLLAAQSKLETKKYNKLIRHTIKTIERKKDTKTAVVIHLYYIESWGLFVKKLKNLKPYKYDLFITMPNHNKWYEMTIKESHPEAYIFIVPNKGRDVLPFLKILSKIHKCGYQNILKIHSKKSNHRSDGEEWLNDMIEKLLPDNSLSIKKIFNILEKSNTSIIGPKGHYISLSVNFKENWNHIRNVILMIYSNNLAIKLKNNPTDYGFFAGTMFWSRVDALLPIIIEGFDVSDFEKEKGQIDCTLAHALERVFCLVPEINSKDIYEINKDSINKIEYKTDNIPDWSNVKLI